MTRTKPDEEDTPTPSAPAPAPDKAPTPAVNDTSTGPYEPYPGREFFHGGRHSPLFQVMGRRLVQEGCGRYAKTESPGPDWTSAHRRSFTAWQEQLRPKGGGDTSGIPDEVAWDRLQVPRVTPLARGEGR